MPHTLPVYIFIEHTQSPLLNERQNIQELHGITLYKLLALSKSILSPVDKTLTITFTSTFCFSFDISFYLLNI